MDVTCVSRELTPSPHDSIAEVEYCPPVAGPSLALNSQRAPLGHGAGTSGVGCGIDAISTRGEGMAVLIIDVTGFM